MIPKFRAWLKNDKEMIDADEIHWDRDRLDFIGDGITFVRKADEVYIEKEYAGTFIGGMPAIYLKGIGEGYAWTGSEEIIGNTHEKQALLEVTHDQ